MRERRIATPVEREQTCRSNDQSKCAGGSEHDGQTPVVVWCNPPKDQVINRRDRRRCEAEREPVERAVMQPSPPRPALLLGVDTVFACGVKVLEREDIAGGLLSRNQSPVAQAFMA